MVLEKTLESPLDSKELKPVNPKGNQSWIFIEKTDAEAEPPEPREVCELTHWKRPWCWERFQMGGEGDGKEWDGWMASPTQWIWVWSGCGHWSRTGKPGVLHSMGSQRVGHNWVNELILKELILIHWKDWWWSWNAIGHLMQRADSWKIPWY